MPLMRRSMEWCGALEQIWRWARLLASSCLALYEAVHGRAGPAEAVVGLLTRSSWLSGKLTAAPRC